MRDGWEARTAWLGLVLGLMGGLAIGVVRDQVATRLDPNVATEVLGRSEMREPLVRVVSDVCGSRRWGSGVVLDDGTVITNRHVVDGASSVTVWVDDRALTATDVAVGIDLDVARVTVSEPAPPTDPAGVASIRSGQSVKLASAYGRISSTVAGWRTGVAAGDPPTAWVLDADAAPGMSGGAVIDEDGRWLGVIYAAEHLTGRALVIAATDAMAAPTRPAAQAPC